MCSYQGKLKPAIANALVTSLMPSSPGRLLDPFSGVGTIPLEARLEGHTAFGFDISPAAIAISRAKIEVVDAKRVDREIKALEKWIDSYVGDAGHVKGSIRFNGPLESYFHADTFREILAARAFFQSNNVKAPERALVLGCLLHILHGNRPYALSRNSHPITPFAPTGETSYRGLIERLRAKTNRVMGAEAPKDTQGAMFDQDATAIWPDEVDHLNAIITSPPFFDSTRFYSANWMRLWFAGWNAAEFTQKPRDFVEVRQKIDFNVYEPIFRQAAERLVSGGYFALHLGKSVKCDMARELIRVGSKYLRLVDEFAENVDHCESHGIRDKGTVTEHQYVLFSR
jgi:methylase of polypeptide subunit release factors